MNRSYACHSRNTQGQLSKVALTRAVDFFFKKMCVLCKTVFYHAKKFFLKGNSNTNSGYSPLVVLCTSHFRSTPG